MRNQLANGSEEEGDVPGRAKKKKKKPPPVMEPLRLLPLLASLQTFLPPATPTDLPPPPAITVTPQKMQYLIGDTISLRCSAPWSKEKIQGFQFLGTSGWAVHARSTKRSYVYRFNITGPKDSGSHTCAYTLLDPFRQTIRSQDSKPIILSVKDHPPQPTLTLKPSSGVAVVGQPLLFLCTAPPGPAERKFHFYKSKLEVVDDVNSTSGEGEARLWVRASDRNHTGNFTCGYEEKIEDRWIPSYLSQTVNVLIKGAASAPRLDVDPPSGVVSEDHPFRLTCVASRDDFGLRFRFYRNEIEIPPGQGKREPGNAGNSTTLLFLRTPRNFGGKFRCGVEEEVGGTWVPSPRSEAVDVTVKDLPSQPALLLDPPSGEVLEGDPLVLTCSAHGPVAQRKFVFYKDGVEQFAQTVTEGRALFNIPVAKATLTTGHFACRYEEKVSQRWIPSPLSQTVAVITQARSQLIPLVVGCGVGAVTLILGLLLAVCFCRRRRGSVHWKGLRNKDDPSTYPMANLTGNNVRP